MQIFLYFCSYCVSLLGNSVASVVLPVLVLSTTGSAAVAGAVALVGGIATFGAGIITGPLIDRYDKRKIAFIADLSSACSMALLATAALLDQLTPVVFIFTAILSGIGDLPAWNAREAMIYGVKRNTTLPIEQLVGIRETLSALAIIIGPTCAGLMMSYLQAGTLLWLTAITSLLAALIIIVNPRDFAYSSADEQLDPNKKYLNSLQEGLKFFAQQGNQLLRSLTVLNISSVALVTILQTLAIPLILIQHNLGNKNGFALASIGFGLLIGGFCYAILGTKIKPWTLLPSMTILNILVLVFLMQYHAFWMTILLCFLFGVTSSFAGAITGVLSLAITPETFRGRINGFQNAMSMIVGPIAVFLYAGGIALFTATWSSITVIAIWTIISILVLGSIHRAKPAAIFAQAD